MAAKKKTGGAKRAAATVRSSGAIPSDPGGTHRQRERWSFSEQHQYDIEKHMAAGRNAPKGAKRTWQEAQRYDQKKKKK